MNTLQLKRQQLSFVLANSCTVLNFYRQPPNILGKHIPTILYSNTSVLYVQVLIIFFSKTSRYGKTLNSPTQRNATHSLSINCLTGYYDPIIPLL
jgi:hypothetical protein